MYILFLKFISTNYKENIAMDRFKTSTFPAVNYAKSTGFVWSYIWGLNGTPHQVAFVSPLG